MRVEFDGSERLRWRRWRRRGWRPRGRPATWTAMESLKNIVFVAVACVRDAAIDASSYGIEDFRVICTTENAAGWKVEVGDFKYHNRISFAFLNRHSILARIARNGRTRVREPTTRDVGRVGGLVNDAATISEFCARFFRLPFGVVAYALELVTWAHWWNRCWVGRHWRRRGRRGWRWRGRRRRRQWAYACKMLRKHPFAYTLVLDLSAITLTVSTDSKGRVDRGPEAPTWKKSRYRLDIAVPCKPKIGRCIITISIVEGR